MIRSGRNSKVFSCSEGKSLLHFKKNIYFYLFIGRTDAEAEAEAPILWPPDVMN